MDCSDLIESILVNEGGYVDHPADRGGPTNHGITLATLSDWRGAPVTAADIEALTRDEARRIYRRRYIEDPKFDRIADPDLRRVVVDAGVLHGTSWASRRLQEIASAAVDGVIGDRTLAKVNGHPDPDELRRAFVRRRIVAIGRIVQRDPSQAVFVVGWLNRATSFI
ncbi:MAG: glycosyl hydrolase 108 family protein [Alphaproteobacteria bacterium]